MLATAFELILIAVGAFFLLVSALGLWRLPDFFQRLHAPTKAATLGLISIFAASLLAQGGEGAGRAVLALLFVGATAPVGAHYLGRTAYLSGVPTGPLVRDEYAGRAEIEPPDQDP